MTHVIDQDDLILIGDAYITEKGLVSHQIESGNNLYEIGIPQIAEVTFKINARLDDIIKTTDDNKTIEYINVQAQFFDVKIDKPVDVNPSTRKEELLFPLTAFQRSLTYSAYMYVNVQVKAIAHYSDGSTAEREKRVENSKLCKLPIMVNSVNCNRYGLSSEALKRLNEDPNDPGGYFIINGVGWNVDCIESMVFNMVRFFNENHKKERVRAETITKPGDFYHNSDYLIVRWLIDGQITIEIKSGKLKDVYLPFCLVFRCLGWNTDEEIINNIMPDPSSQEAENIRTFLNRAYEVKYPQFPEAHYKYGQIEAISYIAEQLQESKFDRLNVKEYQENYQKITNTLFGYLDNHFLQHLGTTVETRPIKMRYLARIIRKMFLVDMGIIPPTDRDSYFSKRIHTAGQNLAKAFKTHFNTAIINKINQKIKKEFKTMKFEEADLGNLVKLANYGSDFQNAITSSIKSGSKSQVKIGRIKRPNRLMSRLLGNNNEVDRVTTLRYVGTPNTDKLNQSVRAKDSRKVHPTYIGYIDAAYSPEGQNTGHNKNLSIFATITTMLSSAVIKDILLEDPEVYPVESKDYLDVINENLQEIHVNGAWVGFCKDAAYIARKYRRMRRELKISPEVAIIWVSNENEVHFWVDVGRPIRPLIIVYNTTRDPEMFTAAELKSGKFIQKIAVTTKHIDALYAKTITFEDLLAEKLVELITAGEQDNVYIAGSYDILMENMYNDERPFTHCDIPQSIVGVAPLTSPYSGHNQSQRTVFQANQRRQTGGNPPSNWPFLTEKSLFIQCKNEMPLIKTYANSLVYQDGANCMVAIMSYGGNNQEDSVTVDIGAVDRGLYYGTKLITYYTKLESGEEFGNPDMYTSEIKVASYEHLTGGIIKKGTIIHKNDAIIGKKMYIKNPQDEFKYTDLSIIYKDNEAAIVHNVIVAQEQDNKHFCKVVIRKFRPVSFGDKFSCLPTAQVLTNSGWKEIRYLNMDDKVATLDRRGYLDYVWPSGISSYMYQDDMYNLSTPDLEMTVTKNHKLYVTCNADPINFTLTRAEQVMNMPDVNFYRAAYIRPAQEEPIIKDNITFSVHEFWTLMGMFNSSIWFGMDVQTNIPEYCKGAVFEATEKFIRYLDALGIMYYTELDQYNNVQYIVLDRQIHSELNLYVYNVLMNTKVLKQEIPIGNAARAFIMGLMFNYEPSYFTEDSTFSYVTASLEYANLLTQTAIHAGWSARIKDLECGYEVVFNTSKMVPKNVPKKVEQWVPYHGLVYCLEIPDSHQHVYYMRETVFDAPAWTGNSARSGQKGTVGTLMDEADMPYTVDGMRPDIIMNPHGIPTRMTIGQEIESMVGGLAAFMGVQMDATIFKNANIQSISDMLKAMGLNPYGEYRMLNAYGEYIDTCITFGPTFYQRLLKFAQEIQYAVSSGPSDSITLQPPDGGKKANGGLRLGEMEVDVLTAHGSAAFMSEKLRDHSDGYVEDFCSTCGKQAIVNENLGIYKCNTCGPKARFSKIHTTWTAKNFRQELHSMNVGVRYMPDKIKLERDGVDEFKHIFETVLK